MHQKWWCEIIYRDGCPGCKVRQLRYGFRLDPMGYRFEVEKVRRGYQFSPVQRWWILKQVGELGE